ncbi:GNAT family N-acetyltransferase [Clostridium thermosuccinogenes]|uniref:GNAT family N-acetyltransferase n=1 Tax=Clostridium thermosuccinogenes TaxID=84032 RepID=A0A2K2FJH4_9CLOT|nr:GNAT family N-acetyltransferase [Pseudoclostridium thermosuccinogenes]AUS98388.1 GNAT family N-acetyltransferase [Pseudoclostridium thermosuccinogenes]PNT98932.1 GNAT family N-acetyltransferase [Pseudoclostridium thermosuccinogenes]PNU00847.1 GNAT family N-acetyltransferase [Pseudoclostridium thermosuccinogenes]
MYKVRRADVNDAKALGEIHASSWKIAYKGIVPDSILDNISAYKRQKYFEKALSEGWEEDFLIFADDKAVGLMCIGRCRDEDKDDTYGEIWGLYLLPEYWNKGIGSYFINWGLNELKNRGYKKVTLWVLEENLNARKFYEKMGFKHDGTVKELTLGKKLTEFRYLIELCNRN